MSNPALKKRVITALILAPTAISLVLLIPTFGWAIVTAVLCLLALWEWSRLSGLRDRRVRGVLLALYLTAMGLLWIYRGSTIYWALMIAGALWWLVAIFWLRHFSYGAAPTPENTRIKLLVGLLMVLPAWTALVELHQGQPYGHFWALLAIMLVWAADTSAYFTGVRFGKTKLAPHISPGKTREGALGGLIGAGLTVLVGGWLLGVHGWMLLPLLILGLLSVSFSIIGDLFESLIKRHANVKDSGAMFPGHGGVFDRLDAIFAAMPVFVIGKTLLGL